MKDNHQNIAPWDEGFYQTGTVAAPRQRGGLVMVLLVAVVLLGGAVTILGLLNIRLFVALKQQEKNALQLHQAPPESADLEVADYSPGFEMVLSPVPQERPTVQEIYSESAGTTVRISCGDAEISGVVMHRGGYIVTNRHAVVSGEAVSVRLPDNREFAATVVGSDVMTDLAVLYIDAPGLTPAVFGDSEGVQVGDSVCAIRHSGTLTEGTVQALADGAVPAIGTDTDIHSGSPLLDCYGRVIGIRNACQVVPSATVKTVVEQLVHQGFVSGRPGLGICCEPVSERYQCYYDLPAGLYVSQVTADSALESGDILLAVGGKPVSDSESLNSLLCGYDIGDRVTLTVLRGDRQINLTAAIEPTP